MPGKQKDEARGLVKDVAPLKLESSSQMVAQGVAQTGSALSDLLSLEGWAERKDRFAKGEQEVLNWKVREEAGKNSLGYMKRGAVLTSEKRMPEVSGGKDEVQAEYQTCRCKEQWS